VILIAINAHKNVYSASMDIIQIQMEYAFPTACLLV